MTYSPIRNQLCSRQNAERVAYRMLETTGEDISITRQSSAIQPYLVARANVEADGEVTMQLRIA